MKKINFFVILLFYYFFVEISIKYLPYILIITEHLISFIFVGNVFLNNVEVKKSAFDRLDLPFLIKEGTHVLLLTFTFSVSLSTSLPSPPSIL